MAIDLIYEENKKRSDEAQKAMGVSPMAPIPMASTPLTAPIAPTVTAESLINPKPMVRLGQPVRAMDPGELVAGVKPLLQNSSDYIVRSDSEMAKRRDDVLGRLLSVEDQNSQDIYTNAFRNAGGEDTLKKLTEENLRLTSLVNKYDIGDARISTTAGSKIQEGIELDESRKMRAAEVGAQAAIVQALQGNYDLARQTAKDTVEFSLSDREANIRNLERQYDAIQNIVEGEEAQLLELRREALAQEKERLANLKNTINAALEAGGATPDELRALTNPSLDDDTKLATAQAIISRTAGENRQFDIEDRMFDRESELFNRGLDLAKFDWEQQQAIMEAEGEWDKPLSTEDLIKFGGLPAGTTWADVMGAGLSPEKPPTDAQKTAASFAERIQSSNTTLDNLEGYITKLGPTKFWWFSKLDNRFKPAEIQQFEQAQRDFINAILRKESGAAIADSEFENARKQYFPQPGDKSEVLQQKKQAREQALENIAKEAGNAFRKPKSLLDLENSVQGNINEKGGLTRMFSSIAPAGSRGGQCGTFAHKLVNFPSVGDLITEKFASVRKYGKPRSDWSKSPRVGDVIVTNENAKYGHVAVVNRVLPNGKVQLSESNFVKANTVSHNRVIDVNSPKIYGAIKGTPIV